MVNGYNNGIFHRNNVHYVDVNHQINFKVDFENCCIYLVISAKLDGLILTLGFYPFSPIFTRVSIIQLCTMRCYI